MPRYDCKKNTTLLFRNEPFVFFFGPERGFDKIIRHENFNNRWTPPLAFHQKSLLKTSLLAELWRFLLKIYTKKAILILLMTG